MHQPRDAAAADALAPQEPRARSRWWIRPAPGPEGPDSRDRKGVQAGMILALGGATLFWAGAAALILLLHRG